MNAQVSELKGIKEKTVTYYGTGDTLIGYYEYDKKGRLTKRFDIHEGDSVYFEYDNTDEWVLQRSVNGDTIAKRTIQFDQKNKQLKATIEKKGVISSFEVKKVNDTLFQVYSNGYLHSTVLLDKQERVKRFIGSSNWQTVYGYRSDTLFTTLYESTGDTSVFSTTIFEDGKLVVIDETFVDEGRYQHKIEYNADKKIVRSFYGIYFKGSFTYYLQTEYDYNKSGQLIKETYYQQWSPVEREINYTYY